MMPIRPELRGFYPLDWSQLSAVIRFERAKGRCEHCGRPHGSTVHHLGDGRWWDADRRLWRDGKGRPLPRLTLACDMPGVKTTKVWLATAHLDHDTLHNTGRNLAALCQRCHLLHDRQEHQRRRRLTLRSRKALGDLFNGIYRKIY